MGMAIRDSIGNLGATSATQPPRGGAEVAALWKRFGGRTSDEKRADRETAVNRTLAGSSNPTLLHEHLTAQGW